MELSSATVGALLAVAIGASLAAVVMSLLALLGQRRVRASYRVFSLGSREDVLTLLRRHIEEVRGLRGDVGTLRDHSYGLREMLAGAISRVHTVRYDAFDDMGGHLSFSTAFLDEHGDGMVVTAINGRTDTRVYAKAVRAGRSSHHLSEEEERAILKAVEGGARDGEEKLSRREARVIRDAS
ncbi:MAG: DUF4446 family protein [Nitriliruptorales bacterium]|nr:DUF4446 family protein [Nitriliruptorales bacterium]